MQNLFQENEKMPWEETESEIRHRLMEPGMFHADSFRRKEIAPGVAIILGRRENESTMTPQAIRFDKAKFTLAQAQDWMESHDAEFSEASDRQPDEIEIFQAGDYGKGENFSEADLQKIAVNLPLNRVPLVLGHPTTDAPSHGWVSALRASGSRLFAKVQQVSDDLKRHVREGRYGPVSVAIYRNLNGQGPALRHIGFLGAVPPRVKGMEPVTFAEGEFVDLTQKASSGNIATVLFSTSSENEMKDEKQFEEARSGFRKVMEFFGLAAASAPPPTAPEPIAPPAALEPAAAFAERESALAKREAEIKAAEAKIADAKAAANRAECVAFCEKLVTEHRLLPAQRDAFVDVFLPMDGAKRLEFAEKSLPKIEGAEKLFTRVAKPQEQPGNIDIGAMRGKIVEVYETTICHMMSEHGKSRADAEAEIVRTFTRTHQTPESLAALTR